MVTFILEHRDVMCIPLDFVLRVSCQQVLIGSRDVVKEVSWWLIDIV